MDANDTAASVRFERVFFFSDAVFAIAATSPVIDLHPPVTDATACEGAPQA